MGRRKPTARNKLMPRDHVLLGLRCSCAALPSSGSCREWKGRSWRVDAGWLLSGYLGGVGIFV